MNKSDFQKSDNPDLAVRAQKNKTETQQQNDRFILMLISSAIVMMKLRLPSLSTLAIFPFGGSSAKIDKTTIIYYLLSVCTKVVNILI